MIELKTNNKNISLTPSVIKGEDGRGIAAIDNLPNNDWIFTYTDGTEEIVSNDAYKALEIELAKKVNKEDLPEPQPPIDTSLFMHEYNLSTLEQVMEAMTEIEQHFDELQPIRLRALNQELAESALGLHKTGDCMIMVAGEVAGVDNAIIIPESNRTKLPKHTKICQLCDYYGRYGNCDYIVTPNGKKLLQDVDLHQANIHYEITPQTIGNGGIKMTINSKVLSFGFGILIKKQYLTIDISITNNGNSTATVIAMGSNGEESIIKSEVINIFKERITNINISTSNLDAITNISGVCDYEDIDK